MKKYLKLKFKLYRKFKGEIWGEVILKGKLTALFKIVINSLALQLKNFYLRKYRRINRLWRLNRFKKTLKMSKRMNISTLNKLRVMRKANFIPAMIKRETSFNAKAKYMLSVLSKYEVDSTLWKSKLINWKGLFWLNFKGDYWSNKKASKKIIDFNWKPKKSLLGRFMLHLYSTVYSKFYLLSRMFNYFLWLSRLIAKKKKMIKYLIVKRKTKKSTIRIKNFVSKIAKTQRRKLIAYKKAIKKVGWLKLYHDKFLIKKRGWYARRLYESKISIFYGISNRKKFRFLLTKTFTAMKLHAFFLIKLECMLSTVLLRLNLFPNIYFIQNFIRIGGCKINEKIVFYPFYVLKLGDVVSIDKKYFKKIFNIFFKNLYFCRRKLIKNKKYKKKKHQLISTKIILNVPRYVEVNYKILHALIWRLPNRRELVGPNLFPINFGLYNWSIGFKSIYQL